MPDWQRLIAEAQSQRPPPINGQKTFLRGWKSFSKPVQLACPEGEYVVKGLRAGSSGVDRVGRTLFTDQVVGRLGRVVGAPVAEVQLIDVPQELIAIDAGLQHMQAGVSHGSCFLPDCSDDRETIKHCEKRENRSRFASLAVLYGWVLARDHQFIYTTQEPRLVYSVDHGHFLPDGPRWTTASLSGAPAPTPDQQLVNACSLTSRELNRAAANLSRASDDEIAVAVALPPDAWGVSDEERRAVAEYLASRRDQLLATMQST